MSKYYRKKILSILLLGTITISSVFATGCTKKTPATAEEKDTSASLIEEDTTATVADVSTSQKLSAGIYDNKTTYSADDLKIQQSFEKYLEEIFMDTYENSSLSLNFLIENPENYDMEKIASAWPTLDYAEFENYSEELLTYTEELQTFSYDSLTSEQQLIYDTLEMYLETEQLCPDSYLFSSPFSLSGLPSQLPLIFTEYTFNSKEDVETYLVLLETVDDYVQAEIDYEKYRNEKGYVQSSYCYESCLTQCENFLEQGDDYLANIFSEKLAEMTDLTEDEKTQYIERNKTAITNDVIPSYQLMISSLKQFLEQETCEQGLCKLENGKKYYSYLLQSDVGTSKTPEELIKLLDENIDSYMEDLMTLVLSDPDIANKILDPDYAYTEPEEIISHLIEMLQEDFPEPASTSYELNDIDAAMADELSVAFYILSPIDNYNKNIIYVNQNRIAEGSDIFPTLAHEGLPGHMYQHDYFCSLNPSYFRSIFSFTGYAEGWAEYVELYSYDWSGLDENTATALKIDLLLSDAIPTRIDLGVNYEGWDVEDVGTYLTGLGYDDSYAETYYETVISAPTVFFTYYVGYLELMELKEAAQDALGDEFSIKDFHQFYLEVGPTYFDIIEEQLNKQLEA